MLHRTKSPLKWCSAPYIVQCNKRNSEEDSMAEETKIEAQAAVEAPAKVAEAVADTVETIAKESAKVAKKTRAATARKAKRQAVVAKATTHRTVRKARKSVRKSNTAQRTAARRSVRSVKQETKTMTNNAFFKGFDFGGFDAAPSFAPFQNVLTQANEQSQELAKRSQKVAGELAELTRANVEAVVEAGRVAAEGARSISQNAVAKSRDGFEQAADAIRSLAEAKSPTEYLQLQGDFARASFDRAVAESSKLTESLVKLAGEAFQPLSNRAAANAERFNTLVA
jgi:phasin family protein